MTTITAETMDRRHTDELGVWLRANGLEPDRTWGVRIIAGATIAATVYEMRDGKPFARGNEAAKRTLTVPLKVPLPAHLAEFYDRSTR